MILLVCIYQISFTFEARSVEKKADQYATKMVDSLKNALSGSADKTFTLPNGESYSLDEVGAEDIAKNFYANTYLVQNGDKKVAWNGATYNDCKNKITSLCVVLL